MLWFTFQIILSVTSIKITPADAILRMREPTRKHVELMCDTSIIGLMIPVSYNLLLIILCTIHGFLTRKLPENFKESWYIFISVSTTMFVWMVFLPTYFTTYYASHQVALLAFCLILNASITLLCLYIPKLYAIYFVEEKMLNIVYMTTSAVGSSTQSTVGVM